MNFTQPKASITLQNVTVRKGGRTLLSGVSSHFAEGTLNIIIGPNGAGKSTLLRTICGLEREATGQVFLGTKNIAQLSLAERASRVAWLPALASRGSEPFAYSVLDLVLFGRFPRHRGHPQENDRQAAFAALESLKIADLAGRSITSLSSGESQKAAIARVIAAQTQVLILDEPCSNLDIGAAMQLLASLQNLAAQGRTIVVTIHDLPLAFAFAKDGCLCLNRGQAEAEGKADDVFSAAVLKRVFQVWTEKVHNSTGKPWLHVSV